VFNTAIPRSSLLSWINQELFNLNWVQMKDEKTISLMPILLLLGIALGFMIAIALGDEYSFSVLRWFIVVSIISMAKYGKRIESTLHEINLSHWNHLRSLNKWNFVITRYALLRATVLFSIYVIPLLLKVRMSLLVFIVSTSTFLFLGVILSYFGSNEWKDCEREYVIRQLKVKGEQLRAVQN
jgi:hypothetical protein